MKTNKLIVAIMLVIIVACSGCTKITKTEHAVGSRTAECYTTEKGVVCFMFNEEK